MNDSEISTVRRFSRTVSQRMGVLNADYLGSGLPLAEARLLFEIGEAGSTVRELRLRLGFDAGYVSRLLRALEAGGLVLMQPDEADARVRRVALTEKGRAEWITLDERTDTLVQSLLTTLGEKQRTKLVAAMAEVERLLRASALTVEIADPASPEARACIDAYFSELQQRFEGGFDPAQTVSAAPEELIPPAGYFLIARLDGEAVGCAGLKIKGDTGEIKRMWVSPSARGLGIAQRLLDATQQQAKEAGVVRLQLDTNRRLTEARSLYERNGYKEIPAYNDNSYADHWFEKHL
jgi:DNA-binding MarR family transcriptional regulator/GNAT superfamily N-acetyltransferase